MYASITLDVTAKSVNLINLDSAISYWGQPDEHLLNGMRDNGHVLGVEGWVSTYLAQHRSRPCMIRTNLSERMMPTSKSSVSQAELARYAKALRAAGIDNWRVEIEKPDGAKVSIVAGKGSDTAATGEDIDALIARVR